MAVIIGRELKYRKAANKIQNHSVYHILFWIAKNSGKHSSSSGEGKYIAPYSSPASMIK